MISFCVSQSPSSPTSRRHWRIPPGCHILAQPLLSFEALKQGLEATLHAQLHRAHPGDFSREKDGKMMGQWGSCWGWIGLETMVLLPHLLELDDHGGTGF